MRESLIRHSLPPALAILAALVLPPLPAVAQDSGDGKKNRMVFEPDAKTPSVHEDAEGKARPVEEAAPSPEPATDSAPAPPTRPIPLPPERPENLPDSVAKILDLFYGQLAKGNIEGAYSALTDKTVIAKEPEEIRQLKEKTGQALSLFGKIGGYEILDVSEVGGRLLGVTCISLGELYPLRWKFFYYKPNDTWSLIDIRVDDGITDLFPDSRGVRAPAESDAP